MGSAFNAFRKLGPAAFVLKAIVFVIVADVLLLAFILLRRTYRKWYFAKRDARMLAIRQRWKALISGHSVYHMADKNVGEGTHRDDGIGRL